MFHVRTDYNKRIQDTENLIPEDEPVFLIRAQSPGAGDTLRFFAATVEDVKCDPVIVAAIREQADRMDKWKTVKVPDAPQKVIILEGAPKSPGSVEPVTLAESILAANAHKDNPEIKKSKNLFT